MKPWETKAHQIVEQHCRQAWRQANTLRNGRLRKKHRPYTVPAIVDALVKALGIQRESERERECKRLFEIQHTGAFSLV